MHLVYSRCPLLVRLMSKRSRSESVKAMFYCLQNFTKSGRNLWVSVVAVGLRSD